MYQGGQAYVEVGTFDISSKDGMSTREYLPIQKFGYATTDPRVRHQMVLDGWRWEDEDASPETGTKTYYLYRDVVFDRTTQDAIGFGEVKWASRVDDLEYRLNLEADKMRRYRSRVDTVNQMSYLTRLWYFIKGGGV